MTDVSHFRSVKSVMLKIPREIQRSTLSTPELSAYRENNACVISNLVCHPRVKHPAFFLFSTCLINLKMQALIISFPELFLSPLWTCSSVRRSQIFVCCKQSRPQLDPLGHLLLLGHITGTDWHHEFFHSRVKTIPLETNKTNSTHFSLEKE